MVFLNCDVPEGVGGGVEVDSIPIVGIGCDVLEGVVVAGVEEDSATVVGTVYVLELGIVCVINKQSIIFLCIRANNCYVCYV